MSKPVNTVKSDPWVIKELGPYCKEGDKYHLVAFPDEKAGKWVLTFTGPLPKTKSAAYVGAVDTISPSDSSFQRLVSGLDAVTLSDVATQFGFVKCGTLAGCCLLPKRKR